MPMRDEFNEARVMEAAEHIRKKMTAFLEEGPSTILKGCPAWEKLAAERPPSTATISR